ncbi:MAG: 16S rRNA (uracil(1498)-N(3))-methyltransferase [Actinomyces urogenitalis]|uniref:16S rRNA (uracil(1498)-N(3))-methyltransferase n=1 Tax=Actinomyces urogenitalis TaxID=103621 RepID=UPI002A7FE065|nr:16S rRNA (uracil(1498)-N(3))-methyltransferase [Actinomyces urogenitalis]MDY3678238.1 16S rRNA (uracil(1498)-N(3))-methyltransferase [Actinomyces urogenitalis]
MTAPVFILTEATVEPAGAARSAQFGAGLVLTGVEARHAVTVRRLRAGERVDLSDGAGLRLVCEVTATEGKDRLAVRVLERIEEPAPSHALVLIQALAKGGRDEQAVETATEVGADVVIPWQAGRSIAQWKGPKVAKGRERWQATASGAAKQARRARVPQVAEPMTTAQLAAWTRETTQAGGTVLVLHEEATAPIGGVSLAGSGAIAVVVGPEGGISSEETAALEAAGATTVRLGPHVMRTASAGPVALAVLAQRAGLWG